MKRRRRKKRVVKIMQLFDVVGSHYDPVLHNIGYGTHVGDAKMYCETLLTVPNELDKGVDDVTS